MNKIFRNIIFASLHLCIFASLLSSCSDWFDVRPKSQVKEEDLFSTASGYRDATLGVYTLMANTKAYAGEMTIGTLDVLAQQYTSAKDPYNDVMGYAYTNSTVKSLIEGMWTQSYQAIANCNYILKNIEENGNVMDTQTRNIVKSEAIATRAYLHFDMLRLFAPSYKAGKDATGVPYVNTPTTTVSKPLTVSAMCDQLISDLKEARELSKASDPILNADYNEKLSYDTEDYLEDDGFLLYRTSRMNYYAITALLARISLYKEDMSSALSYAKEVIDCGKFQFINDDLISADNNERGAGGNFSDYTFMQSVAKHEYIAGLYYYGLKEDIADSYYSDNNGALLISDGRKMQVFGADGIDFDIRAKRMFSVPSGNANEYCSKYFTGTQIPLLKIGEMYLIAAEASGDINYIKTLREQRGYAEPVAEGANLIEELQKEYQREFIGEGQLFYYYKRMNLSVIPFTAVTADNSIYVLTEPDDEIEFGYK